MSGFIWLPLVPFFMVVGLGLIGMLLTVFMKEDTSRVGYFSFAGLLAVAAWSASYGIYHPDESVTTLAGMVTVDRFSIFFYILFAMIGAVSILSSIPSLVRDGGQRGEYYVLLLFSLAGMFVMVSSNNLITLFLGFETMSLGVYVLTGWRRHAVASNEAALKYFFLGSFMAGIFLYGIALVYGATGSTNLLVIHAAVSRLGGITPMLIIGALMVLVSVGFKIAAFPFHMWLPDVYEGAPTPVTGFMATAVKAAAFALLIRLFLTIFPMGELHAVGVEVVWWLAILSMFAGNVFALVQKSMKRMLAYSSVAHTGYLLAAVVALPDPTAASAIMYYLVAYAFTNLGAFACVAFLNGRDEKLQNIEDFTGAALRYPLVGLALAVCMFSLIGFPPTAGFFGKYYLFIAIIKNGYTPLAVVLIANSILSVYYYLRVIVLMYMLPADRQELVGEKPALATKLAIGYAAIAIIWAGVGTVNLAGVLPGVEPLLVNARHSVMTLIDPTGAPMLGAAQSTAPARVSVRP